MVKKEKLEAADYDGNQTYTEIWDQGILHPLFP